MAKRMIDLYVFLCETHNIGRRGGKKVRILTNQFKIFMCYYSSKKAIAAYHIEKMWAVPNFKARLYGLRILNFVEIIDAEYKYGTNELTEEEILNSDIEFSRINCGFNGYTKKQIHMDKIVEKFKPINNSIRQLLVHKTIRGPIIMSRPNTDFIDPYCYDIKSAYPYWAINGKFPMDFTRTNKIIEDPDFIYFGRIVVKGLRAKNLSYLPLFMKEEGPDENDVDVRCSGKRIIWAQQYSGYGFLYDLIPLITNNYEYDELTIDRTHLWKCRMDYLPQESRDAFINLFNKKEKTGNKADKLVLNRSAFGIFITHKTNQDGVKDAADYKVPYQIGIYIMSHQAWYMDSIIQKIGVEHIIAAHTDSIKADCDISSIMEEENKRSSINRLGTWEKEDIARICYYSNTRAKYLTYKGELGIKHGGISQEDIDSFIRNKTYYDINQWTEIRITVGKFFKDLEGRTDLLTKKKTVLFGQEEDEE